MPGYGTRQQGVWIGHVWTTTSLCLCQGITVHATKMIDNGAFSVRSIIESKG
jgi:hypothetical protein